MSLREFLSAVFVVGLLVLIGACGKGEKEEGEKKAKDAAEPTETEAAAPEEQKAPAKPGEETAAAEKKRVPTWDLEGELAPELHAAQWFNTEKPLTLQEFRDKKFVLIEFWFTTCPHCIKEAERIQEFHSRFTGANFQVITMVSDLKDDRAKVENFIKDHQITFPVALDDSAKTFTAYAMRKVPFVYIINRYGYVIWQGHPHYLEARKIQEILEYADEQ